jgi:hypothetical protein
MKNKHLASVVLGINVLRRSILHISALSVKMQSALLRGLKGHLLNLHERGEVL